MLYVQRLWAICVIVHSQKTLRQDFTKTTWFSIASGSIKGPRGIALFSTFPVVSGIFVSFMVVWAILRPIFKRIGKKI